MASEKVTEADETRNELTAKVAGILGSQQARDAGIESADLVVGEIGTIGLVLDDGAEYFVTVDSA